jgi:hypothetical protein
LNGRRGKKETRPNKIRNGRGKKETRPNKIRNGREGKKETRPNEIWNGRRGKKETRPTITWFLQGFLGIYGLIQKLCKKIESALSKTIFKFLHFLKPRRALQLQHFWCMTVVDMYIDGDTSV